MVKIAPSILSADFAYICDEIKKWRILVRIFLHIDVMDGHFVPNITLGAPIISCLRKITKLPFDVHLMIEKPERYIDDFIDAGADILTVHAEASLHLHRTINYIKNRGIIPAIALNPSTSLDCLKYVLDDVGMILIMSVNPGFGGQKFISNMLGKIRDLKQMLMARKIDIPIEVDGGVNIQNAKQIVTAGASIFSSRICYL